MIDVSNYRVVYGDKVLNALAVINWEFSEERLEFETRKSIIKAEFLEVLAINEDGNIVSIYDEAWRFQFIPKLGKEVL